MESLASKLEAGAAKDGAPLLGAEQPRSDAPEAPTTPLARAYAHVATALRNATAVHAVLGLGALLLTAALLAAPPLAGLSYAEALGKIGEASVSALPEVRAALGDGERTCAVRPRWRSAGSGRLPRRRCPRSERPP